MINGRRVICSRNLEIKYKRNLLNRMVADPVLMEEVELMRCDTHLKTGNTLDELFVCKDVCI